jgi:hypothetical protein
MVIAELIEGGISGWYFRVGDKSNTRWVAALAFPAFLALRTFMLLDKASRTGNLLPGNGSLLSR